MVPERLVLPALTGIVPVLVPLVAVGIALLMIGAMIIPTGKRKGRNPSVASIYRALAGP